MRSPVRQTLRGSGDGHHLGLVVGVLGQPVLDLAPTKYQIGATGLGDNCYLASSSVVDLTTGVPAAPIAVLVAPAASIRGKPTGAADPRAYSVVLAAVDAGAASGPVQVVFPDAGGKFTFGGLRPGRYRIAAQSTGVSSNVRWINDAAHMLEIQIVAGAPTEMDLPAPVRQQ